MWISNRRLPGQKPKHAPFCMNGATTYMSPVQIGSNLASNWCLLYKLPEHVQDHIWTYRPTEHNDKT